MKLEKITQNSILFVLFRVIVGFIFIYAGIEKIRNPGAFAETIDNYRLLPDLAINLFAIILPWLEVLAGLFLLLGIFLRGSSLIILGMLIMFTAAITINVIRGVDISCGCKTPWELSDKIGLRKLVEEIILLLMMIQVYFKQKCVLCLDGLIGKRRLVK